MRFLLDAEQRAFAGSLGAMLARSDTPSVIRDWSRGEHARGRALWSRIAEAGVFALAVPEAYEGLGPRPVELAVAFVELGRHAVPGPLVETVAAAALLAGIPEPGPAKRLLPALGAGEAMVTLSHAGYALDADAADLRLAVSGADVPTGSAAGPAGTGRPAHELRLAPAPAPGALRPSLDPARRLSPLPSGGELLAAGQQIVVSAADALAYARLTTAAQALGVGEALLDKTVTYVRQRTQFGAPIGSFQAVKHRLADAKIALEFARPLLFGAALTMAPADIAAAKVTACEAAYATARTALQLHGAIGYTAEYDLSLWLTKARALRTAWGGPDVCRAEVLSGDRRW
ncbi:acyl-CoA dehydrogenase family protein [Streptomyces sp. HD]|uniref:acyl-CoA dehydrogenase family protein n=1 Tax=Streptomyces sp. HD TaxID=3020892 RepID=UPI00232E5E7B|nr:acyl-CoA dehydrogenase family protein [Streptomyces sp. HD]MDC0770043.1 acyl-CoA/acyl-ACP dehydrogenase [Streptomyces sp. HD]